MKPFGALLSFEEAKSVVLGNIKPVTGIEDVGIDDAQGRVLAEDIVAAFSSPPFDRAAMDGYAVKAKDTFNSGQRKPNLLKIIGEMGISSIGRLMLKAKFDKKIAFVDGERHDDDHPIRVV